jgi:hypothetical protein
MPAAECSAKRRSKVSPSSSLVGKKRYSEPIAVEERTAISVIVA